MDGDDTPELCIYDGKQVEMPEGMEKQGYFSEENGLYFFQVTEKQFDELTQDYFKALEESAKERENDFD